MAPTLSPQDHQVAPPLARPPGLPFERQTVSISKAEYIQLKHDAHYWRAQFSKLAAHSRRDLQRLKEATARREALAIQTHATLQDALTQAQAKVRELQHCLFGQKSERSNGLRAKLQPQPAGPRRPRGQQRGTPGHGRTRAKTLPGVVEAVDLPAVDKHCPQCGLALAPYPGSQDSEVIEIAVKAYRMDGQLPRC